MKLSIAAAFCLCLTVVVPAEAADSNILTAPNRALLDACLKAAVPNGAASCIGAIQSPCLEKPGGETTAGSIQCAAQENAAWDEQLNAAYATLMKRDAPAQKARLRAAQRAWIAYRDASCAYEVGQFGGGSLAGVIYAGCIADQTARRAVDLLAQASLDQ